MAIDRSELAAGWAETRRYLLAHHDASEWERCYAPRIRGRRVRLCARCLGIYPGILVGLLVYAVTRLPVSHYYLVALLPLPALVDWTVTTFTEQRGLNVVRTITGFLLGFSYAVGLGHLIGDADVGVLAIGAAYAVVAGGLLVREYS